MAIFLNAKGQWEDEEGRPVAAPSGAAPQAAPSSPVGDESAAIRRETLAARGGEALASTAARFGGAASVPAPEASRPAVAATPSVITKPDGTTIVAPPPQSFKETDFSRTTKESKPTIGEVAGQGQLASAIEQKKDVARETAGAEAQKAGVIAEHEKAEAERLQRVETARKEAIAWGEQEYNKRKQGLDDHLARVDNFQFKGYWADKSTGDKVLSGIAVALGAIGSALSGDRENRALTIINDAVKEDRRQQEFQLAKLERLTDRKREALGISREEMEMRKNNLEYAEVAGLAKAKQELAAKLAKTGLNDAQIKAHATMVGIEEELARARLSFEEKNRKDITTQVQSRQRQIEGGAGAAGGKPTEGNLSAAALVSRMIEDEKTIRGLPPMSQKGLAALQDLAAKEALYDKNPSIKLAAVKLGQYTTPDQVLSDQDRLAYNAGKRFIASYLRGDSGAAISVGEYVTTGQQVLPGIGDKAADIAAKEQARQTAIKSYMIKAGPAAAQVQGQAAGLPAVRSEAQLGGASPTMTSTAPAAASSPESKRVRNKKTGAEMTVYKHSDGQWYESPQ